MSTHPSTFDSTATTRPTTDPEPTGRSETPTRAREAWVARCQTQFDASARDRLHNLADEENWYAARDDGSARDRRTTVN